MIVMIICIAIIVFALIKL